MAIRIIYLIDNLGLNPAELKRSIARLQNKLIRYASSKGKRKPAS